MEPRITNRPPGLGYDPELARKLLAEAGFPGGKNFPRMEYMFNAPAGGGKIHEKIADRNAANVARHARRGHRTAPT